MRLFVALDLPEAVKRKLASLVAELSDCAADVRWVRAESMHLTLKFLGDVEPRELAPIDEVLSGVAGAARPVRARLRDVGSFPHLRRPRVLWAGVETDDDALTNLQAATDTGLNELGFRKEKRGYRPHVTIGRARRSGRGLDELGPRVEAHADFATDWFEVGEMTLFESRLKRTGAEYTALARHRLGGRPPP